MENTADSVYFKDRECRFTRVSLKMAQDLGFADPAGVAGKTDADLFGEDFGRGTRLDDERIMATGRPMIGVVESRRLANGHTNWTLTSKLPLRDEAGAIIGLMGITCEINEIRQVEVALQRLATHDTLTDLPNRYLMIDRLNRAVARAIRNSTPFAVMFMDIDHFKDVNDSHGHEYGDQLLRSVAQRLVKTVRSSDTVARIGGDEFVIIMDTTRQVAQAETVARKVQRALNRPHSLGSQKVKSTVSIGISYYPENGRDADGLIAAADEAMYVVKRDGGNGYLSCAPGAFEHEAPRAG